MAKRPVPLCGKISIPLVLPPSHLVRRIREPLTAPSKRLIVISKPTRLKATQPARISSDVPRGQPRLVGRIGRCPAIGKKVTGVIFYLTRAKKLPRATECLVYSLTPSGFWRKTTPKNGGFVGILRGQKCLKRRFSPRSPVGEWSRGARSMRVFGRGSRSQPAALVSDRDDAALFPAIRIDPREIRFCKIK